MLGILIQDLSLYPLHRFPRIQHVSGPLTLLLVLSFGCLAIGSADWWCALQDRHAITGLSSGHWPALLLHLSQPLKLPAQLITWTRFHSIVALIQSSILCTLPASWSVFYDAYFTIHRCHAARRVVKAEDLWEYGLLILNTQKRIDQMPEERLMHLCLLSLFLYLLWILISTIFRDSD